jgi:hypothetical protein
MLTLMLTIGCFAVVGCGDDVMLLLWYGDDAM